MRGRDQEHLSVIDVPGILKKSTPEVTAKAIMVIKKVLECIRVEERKKLEKERNQSEERREEDKKQLARTATTCRKSYPQSHDQNLFADPVQAGHQMIT